MARRSSYAVSGVSGFGSVARELAILINIWGLPEFRASTDGGVLIVENVSGNVFSTTFTVFTDASDSVGDPRPEDVEAATAVIDTRVEGINYYNVDVLNIELGSGADVFNVQGTTAVTNLHLNDGDDQIFVSSESDFGAEVLADPASPNYLNGHLHQVNGALNIDAGAGEHKLMISGESSTLDNDDIVITDQISDPDALAGAEIQISGLGGGDDTIGWFDQPSGTITYQAGSAVDPQGFEGATDLDHFPGIQ